MQHNELNDQRLQDISDLVEIPSDTREGELAVLEHIEKKLGSVPNLILQKVSGEALVAEKGCLIDKAHTSVLLHAHVDTVPGEEHALTLKEISDKVQLLQEVVMQYCAAVPANTLNDLSVLKEHLAKENIVKRVHKLSNLMHSIQTELRTGKKQTPGSWPNRYSMQVDRDMIRGLGVADMKSAVAVLMWLAKEVELPEGVHLTLAFLRDEEQLSRGAVAVQDWIRNERRRYHLCISSDVEPRSDNELDQRQRIIIARRGAAKIEGSWSVPRQLFGHAATGAVTAIESMTRFQAALKTVFEGKRMNSTNQFPTHMYLGDEKLNPEMVYADARGGMVPGHTGEFAYTTFLTPPPEQLVRKWLDGNERDWPITGVDILNFALQRQRLCVQHILESDRWRRWQGITCDLALAHPMSNLSYPPFEADKSHTLIKLLARTAKKIAHPKEDVQFVGALSNADANLFDSFFRDHQEVLDMQEPTITVDLPYLAYGAHSEEERASTPSIAAVFTILKEFLEKKLALAQGNKR